MAIKLPTARAPLEWVASSLKDLRSFPEDVKDVMGYALDVAQTGGKHPSAKRMKHSAFRGVLEIVDDYDGNTYRAIYTVRFANVIYVLDAFQKKSKTGGATPKQDLDRIEGRLKLAEDHYRRTYAPKQTG